MTFPTAARLSRRLVPSAFIFVLASCSGLFGGETTHLYRLTPKSTYPPNLPHRSVQLLVDVPLAPAGLDNPRIALSRSPVSIDYFADSEWTDRVPLLVQTALLQSFENSKTVIAIDRESVGLRADFVLRTEIRHFEAVYGSSDGPPEVWASIIVKLVNPSSRDVVAQTSFERRRRASANDVPSIVSAFDEAIGGVMQDIVVWTVTNPALSVKPA
ncbi:MAG: membrane integrity-associated transporter subunit PqiC [Alphaproteobacteria bacterium]|nr:membrane integrity-associated transporter subunit PqiC [Alphaproteobacteria bacterium]MBV9378231.1 membrane integrity-associated transporter subunit PqiC [Alphaproteobacteria bacterium]MBV9816093.1 membrane integrity-associated transporter subunit PqiC [Alphaproteobacteria bacterium]